MKMLLIAVMFIPFAVNAQLSRKDSIWLPFKKMIGNWKGTGDGVDGKGSYERSYNLVLNKNYIAVKNKTIYSPNEKAPKGYIHEDVGYISYDRMRKKFIFRQFHSEGFVNEYVLDSISADGNLFVFESEKIENIPPGWRAREILMVHSNNELVEEFNLAEPGKDFKAYTKAVLTKEPE